MSDGTLPYQNPTVTDARLDVEDLTVSAVAVKRERIQVTGTVAAAIAAVVNAAPTTEYGLVVRNIPSGTQTITGDVAHDAVDSGNPVKVAGVAKTSVPTPVSDADRVQLYCDPLGRQIMTTGPRALQVKARITLSGSSEVTILGAGASGIFHDLTLLTIANTLSSNATISIRDSTAGTIIQKLHSPGNQTIGFNSQMFPITQTTAANNWTAQADHTVGGIEIFAQAVKTQ